MDTLTVHTIGHVTAGFYGGCTTANAYKNEDAALVWAAPNASWVFAALLDAHGSPESADLVLHHVAELRDTVAELLGNSEQIAPFRSLSALITDHLGDANFRQTCASIRGETALLLCAQKGGYLWWLSVGDILAYAFHPEFARLGQFALNQRMFFEWIGQVNTFALPVPCYASGVRQLRAGTTRILLTTDGLLEYGTRPLENPRLLYNLFAPSTPQESAVEDAIHEALNQVHTGQGRDSATLISWEITVPESSAILQPSA